MMDNDQESGVSQNGDKGYSRFCKPEYDVLYHVDQIRHLSTLHMEYVWGLCKTDRKETKQT